MLDPVYVRDELAAAVLLVDDIVAAHMTKTPAKAALHGLWTASDQWVLFLLLLLQSHCKLCQGPSSVVGRHEGSGTLVLGGRIVPLLCCWASDLDWSRDRTGVELLVGLQM